MATVNYSRMSQSLGVLLGLLTAAPLLGQMDTIPLYDGPAPCATGRPLTTEVKPDIGLLLTDVPAPELHHYAPIPRADRKTAVVIIPGGGYYVEAWELEGTDIANYLTHRGFHAFVLRHRLPGRISDRSCKERVALEDARRAMLTVRKLADDSGIERIGIMGFSAGGHLAGSASVHHQRQEGRSSRPDFSVLVYPVTLMGEAESHNGSAVALLGDNPDPELLDYYNLPERVDSTTPPAILIHAIDDEGVPVENSLRYFEALRRVNVPASLIVYPEGGHGFGAARYRQGPVSGWLDEVVRWIETRPAP